MITSEDISGAYSKAREEIKKKNPKMARQYILTILNCALKSYKMVSSIREKAELEAFMDKWLAVSKDLYAKGITDYVLDCFGLLEKKPEPKIKKPEKKVPPEKQVPKPDESVKATPPGKAKAEEKVKESQKEKPEREKKSPEIDIAGLFDDKEPKASVAVSGTSKESITNGGDSQGWCADIFNSNRRAVVKIHAYDNKRSSGGTGFIISTKGYLLTNNHVAFDEEKNAYWPHLSMSFANEKETYQLKLLWVDKKWDLALCSFVPSKVPSFTPVKRSTDYSKLLPGADCLVIGDAFGFGIAPCNGVVKLPKDKNGNLAYTCPINPGDSGGPVFARNGECIGINKSRIENVGNKVGNGYAYATPMDIIDKFLKAWCEHSKTTL